MEKTMGAMSQGEAGADVIVQGVLIILSFAGIFLRHPIGWVAGLIPAVLWIYVTLMVLFQRWMLFRWGVVDDLPIMVLIEGIPGVLIILCLLPNRDFFGW